MRLRPAPLLLHREDKVGRSHPTLVIVHLSHVEIDGRGFKPHMTESFLDTTDVNAVFQKMRGETVTQGVNGVVPDNYSGESSESRQRFTFNRAKRVIDGRIFGVPLEPAEAE